MKIVAVVVYDRFENIKEWCRCWAQVRDEYKPNTADLVIVHNYRNIHSMKELRTICGKVGVTYIARRNIGLDIGAFQDVCRERLKGFPKFDELLWCTDDCIPMRHTFLEEMTEPLNRAALVGLEMSLTIKAHIRTTCFALRKSTSLRIQFPADPVITKDECYRFEHRDPSAIYEQCQAMGGVLWYSQVHQGPLWDTGHRLGFNRHEEHYKNFPQL